MWVALNHNLDNLFKILLKKGRNYMVSYPRRQSFTLGQNEIRTD